MSDLPAPQVIVVGAGAAGLATAIFARRVNPALRVRVLDGAAKPGAKILISGGSRCNVTNAAVTEADYWGGKRTIVRRVLASLTVAQTIDFFSGIGVRLKEEPTGKLFPVTDRSRDVLDALLGEARALGIAITPGTRVHEVKPDGRGFVLHTSQGLMPATRVVLATGGLSLPKTGSDGGGLTIARQLGHTIVPTTPALVPLVLDSASPHASISGVAHDVELTLHEQHGTVSTRITGAMLWTHFGISGPAALDMSRHFLRQRIEGGAPTLAVNFFPGHTFETVERRWVEAVRARPRATLPTVMGEHLPASVAGALIGHLGLDPTRRLAALSREERRAIVHGLTSLPLPVRDSRGYNYAEATAGGVGLDEIDPSTMRSRLRAGLYFAGEILDVDGRLGGFNFQWAWSSARTAGEGLARDLT